MPYLAVELTVNSGTINLWFVTCGPYFDSSCIDGVLRCNYDHSNAQGAIIWSDFALLFWFCLFCKHKIWSLNWMCSISKRQRTKVHEHTTTNVITNDGSGFPKSLDKGIFVMIGWYCCSEVTLRFEYHTHFLTCYDITKCLDFRRSQSPRTYFSARFILRDGSNNLYTWSCPDPIYIMRGRSTIFFT